MERHRAGMVQAATRYLREGLEGKGNCHPGRNQVRVQWHEQKQQMRSFFVCWEGSHLMLPPGGALPKLLSAPGRGVVLGK